MGKVSRIIDQKPHKGGAKIPKGNKPKVNIKAKRKGKNG